MFIPVIECYRGSKVVKTIELEPVETKKEAADAIKAKGVPRVICDFMKVDVREVSDGQDEG